MLRNLFVLSTLTIAVHSPPAEAAGCSADPSPGVLVVPVEAATLQEGIDMAPDGTSVLLCDGTYSGPGFTDVIMDNRPLFIGSVSADPSLCILDGQATDQILRIVSSDVEIRGISFTRGRTLTGGGAIYSESSDLRVFECRFTKNTAGGPENKGGAVWINGNDTADFAQCYFEENQTDSGPVSAQATAWGGPSQGGGIYAESGRFSVIDCEFVDNFSREGHAIYGGGDEVEIIECEFVSNVGLTSQRSPDSRARVVGGTESAAVALLGPDVLVRDSEFRSNRSFDGPGALDFVGEGMLTVSGTLFQSNESSEGRGGAIGKRIGAATLWAIGCDFVGNDARRGGAVSWFGPAHFVDCEFRGNDAFVEAGTILATSLTLTDCLVTDSEVSEASESIVSVSDSAAVTNCKFENLRDVSLQASHVEISDSWFVENENDCALGTVTCETGRVTSTTFVLNRACSGPNEASAVLATDALAIENTIIAFGWGSAPAVSCPSTALSIVCTDIYGNLGGDWTDCLSGLLGVDGNFSLDPFFCPGSEFTLASSSPCLPGNHPANVDCGLIGKFGEDCGPPANVPDPADPLSSFSFVGETQNPFGRSVDLSFAVPAGYSGGRVSLRVFNVAGAFVRTLFDGVPTNVQPVRWDGTGDRGETMANGPYFARVEGAGKSTTQRVLLVR